MYDRLYEFVYKNGKKGNNDEYVWQISPVWTTECSKLETAINEYEYWSSEMFMSIKYLFASAIFRLFNVSDYIKVDNTCLSKLYSEIIKDGRRRGRKGEYRKWMNDFKRCQKHNNILFPCSLFDAKKLWKGRVVEWFSGGQGSKLGEISAKQFLRSAWKSPYNETLQWDITHLLNSRKLLFVLLSNINWFKLAIKISESWNLNIRA